MAIDLGVPIVSIPQLIRTAAENYRDKPEYNQRFFEQVSEWYFDNNSEMLRKEKVPLKLLRLAPDAQEGFIMSDYPRDIGTAELMEEYKGGLNAFVHLSLPESVLINIENVRFNCEDCGRNYYVQDVSSPDDGIYINSYMPEDGHCDDCGSTNISKIQSSDDFMRQLEDYLEKKDEILGFYEAIGVLIDFEPRKGWDSYDALKQTVQHNIKH